MSIPYGIKKDTERELNCTEFRNKTMQTEMGIKISSRLNIVENMKDGMQNALGFIHSYNIRALFVLVWQSLLEHIGATESYADCWTEGNTSNAL